VRAALAGDDVGGGVRQNFIAGSAMHQRCRHIAHGAGRHEHGRFLAEQVGHAFAQQIHRWIIADLFVAHFGTRHRLAHSLRRAGLGVRQQVDTYKRGFGIGTGRGVGHGDGLRYRTRPLLTKKGPGKTVACALCQRDRSNQRE
jgi:hypothetical protein